MAKKIEMSLMAGPFEAIESGQKTIEVRLNDEKRQQLNIGDHIIFHHRDDEMRTIEVEVVELLPFPTFRELYLACGVENFGNKSLDSLIESTYTIYTKEQEEKYGTLGIKIKKVK